MRKHEQGILWFNEVSKDDVGIVGGKGANLGEMTQANIPVPPGFIVTASAYNDFLINSGIINEINEILKPLNANDSKQLRNIAEAIKKVILQAPMPEDLAHEIKDAYRKMGRGYVAVRSSATAEDLPEASFAGQQSTYLNIQGEQQLLEAVQKCWASLFEARAIFYRIEHGFEHSKVHIAVPVQRMIQSDASGVMFTLEPVSSDTSKIAIEAVIGLGEMIVSGDVTPDTYIVDKKTISIEKKDIAAQEWKLVRNTEGKNRKNNIKINLTAQEKAQQKIADEDILALAKIGIRLENHYGFPQDIEWAKENNELYIVQTRPVTTIRDNIATELVDITTPVLLSGAPASPGIASGPVKIVPDASKVDKVLDGDILVTEMTTPDFVPAMKRAAAIVTDRGGRTAHAAIVSRELGIPCVVGTIEATTTLKDGDIISVDGAQGKIYSGRVSIKQEEEAIAKERIITKTKVYVNLAQPELVDRVAGRHVDGVGLLRAEFMVAQIGEHPRYMIAQNRGNDFVQRLAEGISAFAKAFHPRPVVYRTNDFKTNEYRDLKGGQDYEIAEENPMIGYRGASRYIADPDVFKLEIQAIKQVRKKYENLWVMIPFVRTVNELFQTKKIMEAEGLVRSQNFKLWMMVEVPSNVLILEKFLDVGIDGISIGSNDLTQLVLGIDRDSEKLADTFDERNEAVMVALERAIKVASSMGVTSSICGQAPSVYPELTEKLVEWGITSVSVSPDMIGTTRDIIAKAEAALKSRK